jgi:hypothetical protein
LKEFDLPNITAVLPQLLDGRFFVPERLQEGERKLRRVEWLRGEIGDGLFDFNGVHVSFVLTRASHCPTALPHTGSGGCSLPHTHRGCAMLRPSLMPVFLGQASAFRTGSQLDVG